jgi:Uma2 family endonuclease
MTISTLPLTAPPLENGDKLTRHEFEHRYAAMPEDQKAELVERCVYMASPFHAKAHAEPHAQIIGWLFAYKALTPGVQLLDNATVRLDSDNEVQPDALLRIENNGKSIISEDDYIEGAPELIVEIAASSASIDLHQKFNVYRRNQVQEYLVGRVYDGELDWYVLKAGKYVTLEPNEAGVYCSAIFPGLWLAKSALLSGDLATVLTTLQQGLAACERTFQ